MASLTFSSEPRRSFTTPVVIAIVALAAIFGAVFYFNPHHTGELHAAHTDVFAPETTFNVPTGTMHIIGQGPQTERSFYAVVTLHLQNDMRLPMFIDEVDGRFVASNDGELTTAAPLTAADLDRVEQIFPHLRDLMPHPLRLGDTVPPKGSLDGQVLLSFGSLNTDDWKRRKPSTVTVHFTHQDPLSAGIP